MFVFEGSPEEIAKVVETMGPMSPLTKEMALTLESTKSSPRVKKLSETPEKYVTKEFAIRLLTRRELSKPVTAVIKRLTASGDEWVSSQELYEASNYKPAQFAGMMGAFGRRMYHTKGYDEEAHFWDFRENEEDGSWEYRLPQSVREAGKKIGLG